MVTLTHKFLTADRAADEARQTAKALGGREV
jgi:hypothetical protein